MATSSIIIAFSVAVVSGRYAATFHGALPGGLRRAGERGGHGRGRDVAPGKRRKNIKQYTRTKAGRGETLPHHPTLPHLAPCSLSVMLAAIW